MLRDIPGISEALLIGEGKPYCSALLWIDDESINLGNIKESIKNINSRVSRPEQVKKWVVLKNDLSIEGDDLTANLKLKRKNIIKHYSKTIEYLYNDSKQPEVILYQGEFNTVDEQ